MLPSTPLGERVFDELTPTYTRETGKGQQPGPINVCECVSTHEEGAHPLNEVHTRATYCKHRVPSANFEVERRSGRYGTGRICGEPNSGV